MSLSALPARYNHFPSNRSPFHFFALRKKTSLNLGGDLGLGVGDLDAELLGAGNDVDALAGRDGAGDPIEVTG